MTNRTLFAQAYNAVVEFTKTFECVIVTDASQWADGDRGKSSHRRIDSFRQRRRLNVRFQILICNIVSYEKTKSRKWQRGPKTKFWTLHENRAKIGYMIANR